MDVFECFDGFGLGSGVKGLWKGVKIGWWTCLSLLMILVFASKAFGKEGRLVGGRV